MKFRRFLEISISALFLVLALRQIHWSEFLSAFSRTRYEYLFLAVGLNIANHVFRSYRWRFILEPVKPVDMPGLFTATAIGALANNLLPARLGDLARAFVLKKKRGIGKAASLGTMVYERFLDVFVLLILLWYLIYTFPAPGWVRTGGLSLLALNVLAMAFLCLIHRRERLLGGILAVITYPLSSRLRDQIIRTADAFAAGLRASIGGTRIAPIVFVSLFVWLTAVLRIYCCFKAAEMSVPFFASIATLVFVSFAAILPSAPAQIGTTQYACILALGFYSVDRTQALAYSLLYHGTQVIPISLVGLLLLWRENLRVAELSRPH